MQTSKKLLEYPINEAAYYQAREALLRTTP